MRFMGTDSINLAVISSSAALGIPVRLMMGVAIGPGATAFTRMLRPTSSAAMERVKERIAAFVAAFGVGIDDLNLDQPEPDATVGVVALGVGVEDTEGHHASFVPTGPHQGDDLGVLTICLLIGRRGCRAQRQGGGGALSRQGQDSRTVRWARFKIVSRSRCKLGPSLRHVRIKLVRAS